MNFTRKQVLIYPKAFNVFDFSGAMSVYTSWGLVPLYLGWSLPTRKHNCLCGETRQWTVHSSSGQALSQREQFHVQIQAVDGHNGLVLPAGEEFYIDIYTTLNTVVSKHLSEERQDSGNPYRKPCELFRGFLSHSTWSTFVDGEGQGRGKTSGTATMQIFWLLLPHRREGGLQCSSSPGRGVGMANDYFLFCPPTALPKTQTSIWLMHWGLH